MTKLQILLKSRKFWTAITGLALVVLRAFVPNFPLSDEMLGSAILLLVAYIVGTGLEDGLAARRSA
jgi:hypothetical protein